MTSAHAGASKKLDQVGLVPPKNGKACACCHARKVKCDGVRPTCTACARSANYAGRDPETVICVYYEGTSANARKEDDHILGTLDDGVFRPASKIFDSHSLEEHRHHPGLSAPAPNPSRKRASSPPPPAEDPAPATGTSTPPITSVSLPPYLQSTLPLDILSLMQPPFMNLVGNQVPRPTSAPEFDWSVFDRSWKWSNGQGTSTSAKAGTTVTGVQAKEMPAKEWQRQVQEATAAAVAKTAPSLSSLRASSPAPSDVSNDSCESNAVSSEESTADSSDFYTTIPELEVVPRKRRKVAQESKKETRRREDVIDDVDVWMRVFETMQH